MIPHAEDIAKIRAEERGIMKAEGLARQQGHDAEKQAFMAGHESGSGMAGQAGINAEQPMQRPAQEVGDTAQYGHQDTQVDSQAAEQIADMATSVAVQNGVNPQDQESVYQIVGSILAKEAGPERMKSNPEKIQQIGSMAMQLTLQNLDQQAKVAGGMNAGQEQAPQGQPQGQPQQQGPAGLPNV